MSKETRIREKNGEEIRGKEDGEEGWKEVRKRITNIREWRKIWQEEKWTWIYYPLISFFFSLFIQSFAIFFQESNSEKRRSVSSINNHNSFTINWQKNQLIITSAFSFFLHFLSFFLSFSLLSLGFLTTIQVNK